MSQSVESWHRMYIEDEIAIIEQSVDHPAIASTIQIYPVQDQGEYSDPVIVEKYTPSQTMAEMPA
jgi:hypothetical protein